MPFIHSNILHPRLLLLLSQSPTMIPFYAFNSFGLPLEEPHLPFVQTIQVRH